MGRPHADLALCGRQPAGLWVVGEHVEERVLGRRVLSHLVHVAVVNHLARTPGGINEKPVRIEPAVLETHLSFDALAASLHMLSFEEGDDYLILITGVAVCSVRPFYDDATRYQHYEMLWLT